MENKEKKGLNVSAKSFITAILVIFALMVVCYILTFIIPAGAYVRDENGVILKDSFEVLSGGGLPFWKWALSPFLLLGSDSGLTTIVVIVFLLIIGGVFNSLNRCGLMQYMINKISAKFGKSKYLLMAIIILFFMAMGSLIGSFEEVVPLVPIVVALAISLGWDVLTGLSISLLAVGCGFAAGVFNPFTIGVAQQYAGLPMFSGAWLRIVAFVLIYALLYLFVYFHAKRNEVKVNTSDVEFTKNEKFDKGVLCFACILGGGILLVFSSTFIKAIQDYTMIIVAVMFLVAGIVSALVSGMTGKELGKTFLDGSISILPAALMILMASSIKYILEEAKILDTILHAAVEVASGMPKWSIILFIYLIVLVMNFFIASGSAKAAMLIPLIVPLASAFNIPAQLCIVAFAFGDGFSNVFYPTNPVLLISLGLVDLDYVKWAKYSWKFQALNLILTSGLLLFGLAVGYC